MSKKDAAAVKGVLEYLVKQNRPYSVNDIFNNLHKEHGKTAVQKACEELSQQGKVREKTYGKQKVYLADQNQYPVVSEAELKAMDEKITKLTETLKQIEAENKKMDQCVNSLNSSIKTSDAKLKLQELHTEVASQTQQLSELKEKASTASPAVFDATMKNRTKYVKEWRKRRRITNDIVNAILEGYPKTKKQLYDDVGIETDEEYHVKPPEV